ncbi:type II toxin-antitoxin system prevent-host-death family antitoxin [Bradyrhizobium sp.]|jgi:prevent-host-death family protein|uniref:type II toxin-antitoxin system Phd/YefM family antitoxin n=1 Tax=Bradyrhizobium sp. TaxID=376 RepID=UPI002E0CF21D|nr:type II toxin-antitoxin system prevent-host-death family antitoxin [Bradyrhizobium sp.]
MKHIQASEAKAKFSELLDQVERGETIAITRHGRIVARITPDEEAKRQRAREAIKDILELRKTAPGATVEEILQWRDEGRRF